MQIHIDKQSEVPARDQLRQQIIFLITTGELAIGAELPSVRQLARRLKLHHNTVSHAYSQLARDGWLIKKRGSRLLVGQTAKLRIDGVADLDDLIDRAIRLARSHGYSLQQLTARVRSRLQAEPSDHLLVVAPERNLGELIRSEVAEFVGHVPDACSTSMLQENPSVAIGAILIAPSYFATSARLAVSADGTVVPISYSPADEHIAAIRKLSQPSAVAVISVSAVFLETANGVLAGAIGGRHSFRAFLLQKAEDGSGRLRLADYIAKDQPAKILHTWRIPEGRNEDTVERASVLDYARRGLPSSANLDGFDLLFCDSLAYAVVKHRRVVKYRLVSEESLQEIENIAKAMLRPKQWLDGGGAV